MSPCHTCAAVAGLSGPAAAFLMSIFYSAPWHIQAYGEILLYHNKKIT